VLENRQSRHQPRRQWRPAGLVLVDRPELPLEEGPVDRPRQLRQRMVHIDDGVQPRAQQISLSRRSFGRITSSNATTQSRLAIRRNPQKTKLQAFEPPRSESLQSQMPSRPENRLPLNGLEDFSRPTMFMQA